MRKYYLIFPIIFFVFDRVLKYLSPSISFEGGFIKIGTYKNFAGAFSLPIAGTIYDLSGVFLLFIFAYLLIKELKTKNNKKILAYSFIVLGGISNMFDRLYFGYVIDYIQLINRSFFNIADIMLIIGVGILIIKRLQLKRKYQPKDKPL